MSIIIVLIFISLSIALGFLGAFLWSMKSGQFEDTDGPSLRMLLEDKSNKQEGSRKTPAE